MKSFFKTLTVAMIAFTLASPAVSFADDDKKIDKETVEKIMAKLTEMKCQMDPDDIEVEDDGYELDDVICEGGKQFDIELDKDLNETGRKDD